MIKGKSHANKFVKRRLCSCYRFWDIVVANIKNFEIFHFDENLLKQICISRRTSSYGLNIEKHLFTMYILYNREYWQCQFNLASAAPFNTS